MRIILGLAYILAVHLMTCKLTFRSLMRKSIKKLSMVSHEPIFRLTSSAFQHSSMIPKDYTCHGADKIPPLKWENAPSETKSFALIVDDPDAPNGTWTHWLVKNIPAETQEIKENTVPGDQVINSWKIKEWKGPKPPAGTHRYFFKLYALNTDQMKANSLEDFYNEAEEHKIAIATLMGKFSASH